MSVSSDAYRTLVNATLEGHACAFATALLTKPHITAQRDEFVATKKKLTDPYEALLAENEELQKKLDLCMRMAKEAWFRVATENPTDSTNLQIALEIFRIDDTLDPYETAIEGDEDTMNDTEKLQTAINVMDMEQVERFEKRRVE